MNKKLFLMSLAMTVALPVLVAPAQAQEVGGEVSQDFSDVLKTHSSYTEIMAMRSEGIISGYPDNTFRPLQAISRAHTAALFVRSLDLPAVREGKEFKDVPKTHAYYDEVQTVYRAGIFDGKSDGTFGINDNLTRAQMAKVLVNAFGLELERGYIFNDVGEDNWAKDYIATLYARGISTGDNGKYKPNNPVSRAHYATFLFRALNPDEAPKPEKPLQPNPPIIGNPLPKPGTVAVPPGWTESVTKEHDKKIEDTVFKYSPKIGTGQQFGRSSMAVSYFDPVDKTERYINLENIAGDLKSINSSMTINDWVNDLNKAIKTGDVVIATDYSYGLYVTYYNGLALLVYIR